MFFIILFSLVPFNVHYLFPFIFVFIFLIVKELSITENELLKISLIIILAIIFLYNVESSTAIINQNALKYFSEFLPKNYQKIAIEEFPYVILKNTKILNKTNFYVFKCLDDGIFSVDTKYLKDYDAYSSIPYENKTNFFTDKNLKRNDLIIFSNDCIVLSNLHGLNVSVSYGLNNSYTNINFPIEYIDSIWGMIIYKIN
jgi:hypothetical protein